MRSFWIWTETGYGQVTRVEGEVTFTETPAGCTEDGETTYLASATVEQKDYTDSKTESIPATGHSFDEGTEVAGEDGKVTREYVCTNCQKHFTVEVTIDEQE